MNSARRHAITFLLAAIGATSLGAVAAPCENTEKAAATPEPPSAESLAALALRQFEERRPECGVLALEKAAHVVRAMPSDERRAASGFYLKDSVLAA